MTKSYPQITIYIRPWCGSVMRVRRWLDQKGIPYTEINVSKDLLLVFCFLSNTALSCQ
jgi:hypothetical protein